MIINGKELLFNAPIKGMATKKLRFGGVSHGLAEAGYDIRIKQDVTFQRGFKEERRVIISDDSEAPSITQSGRFTIASAIEEFQMPTYLVGVVHDKSTWARRGLSVFNTVIEPGWNGFLTLELVYHGEESLHIPAGTGIAQVLFHLLREKGDYADGKYQNQTDAPVKAIMA